MEDLPGYDEWKTRSPEDESPHLYQENDMEKDWHLEYQERLKKEKADTEARADMLIAKIFSDHPAIQSIVLEYSGSGDSGFVDDVITNPVGILTSTEEESLRDVGWDLAYSQNPGFEINDGGQGEITITKDKIVISHSWNESVSHQDAAVVIPTRGVIVKDKEGEGGVA